MKGHRQVVSTNPAGAKPACRIHAAKARCDTGWLCEAGGQSLNSKLALPLPPRVIRRRLEWKRRQLAAEDLSIVTCYPNEIRDFNLAAGEELDQKCLLLSQIVDALARLTAGEYGFCVKCGAEISAERLYAVPWTPHCLHCQELAERDQRRASKWNDESDVYSGIGHLETQQSTRIPGHLITTQVQRIRP